MLFESELFIAAFCFFIKRFCYSDYISDLFSLRYYSTS